MKPEVEVDIAEIQKQERLQVVYNHAYNDCWRRVHLESLKCLHTPIQSKKNMTA